MNHEAALRRLDTLKGHIFPSVDAVQERSTTSFNVAEA
jgi:acyl-CoA oxidase